MRHSHLFGSRPEDHIYTCEKQQNTHSFHGQPVELLRPPRSSNSPLKWLMSFACLILIVVSLLLENGTTFAASTPILVVSSTSITANTECTYNANQGWTCAETLSRGDTLATGLKWVASGGSGIVFTPSHGTLAAGGTATVSIAVPNRVCPVSTTLSFKGPANTVKVPWSCAGPTLTVTPNSFTAVKTCPNSTGGWTCTATVGESASSQGNMNWKASTGMSGTTFTPASGGLSPGATATVSIFVPNTGCSNNQFTFTALKSMTIHTAWNCAPPKLVVSPASLTTSSKQCSAAGSNYTCIVILKAASTSPASISWTASSSLSGVSFTPSSGTLSPGQSVKVVAGSIPCQGDTFTFTGQATGFATTTATTSWTCTTPPPPPTLTVSPTSLSPTNANCSASGSAYQCIVSLGETSGSQGNANWSAKSDLTGVTFSPASGQLSPGGSTTVTIGAIACSNGTFTFSGSEGETPVTVAWSCSSPPPPPTLTVNPTSLDQNNSACSATGSTYQCQVTVGETASSQGTANWSASSTLGVSFSPANGQLTPGQSIQVTISTIPCSTGSFTFAGAEGETAVTVPWSCESPPVLTVSPPNLSQNSPACSATGSTYQCQVTVGVTSSSPNTVTWNLTSSVNGVTFNPSTGQLSAGGSQPVTISNIPCQSASFTFTGSNGYFSSSVSFQWSCTAPPPPPTLTVSPTSLDQNNNACSATGSTYQCQVTIGETASSQGNANWSATSTLNTVSFNPASGQLTPGQSTQVTITVIPCSNGSFTFAGAEGETAVNVTWSCTPSPVLTATPSSLDSTMCQPTSGSSTYQCLLTLTAQNSSVTWTATTSLGNSVSFQPGSGTVQPGPSPQQVTITSIPCQNGTFTFTGQAGVSPVTVPWNCTPPPVLSVTPNSLSSGNSACSVVGDGTYQCSVSLSAGGGTANWTATTDLGSSVIFTPASGQLAAGSSVSVSITEIPCQNGTFTFAGTEGETPISVAWSCTPPPLTVTPASMSPSTNTCGISSDGTTYQCTLLLSSQQALTWSVTTTLGSKVTFIPSASGTLGAGTSTPLIINGIPCQAGSFTFADPNGKTLAQVPWSCTTNMSVTPTGLNQSSSNCSLMGNGNNYHCSLSLSAQGGAVTWTATSNLGSSVKFTPSNGTLTPGNTASISIDTIPCQNGMFTFSGQSGVNPVTVSWSCTPPPLTLTATPTSLVPANCNASGTSPLTYQCSLTLGAKAGSTGSITWSASSDLGSGVSFSPASGTLQPGGNQLVTIGGVPCQAGTFTFSGQTGVNPVTVSWSCTPPPTLTTSVSSLDTNSANCSAANGFYTCSLTLAETAGSQGNANWTTSSSLSGVSFSPSSGQLSPGNSQSITISNILCQNGSFTFSGAEGETSVQISWSCTASSTLSATPSYLQAPNNSQCAVASSSTYNCTITLAETSSSQNSVSWAASSSFNGVSFTPATGSLSPGGSVTVSIYGIPCSDGSFIFSGGTSVSPAMVGWHCLFIVSPTSLFPTPPPGQSCSWSGTYITCLMTFTAGANASVNWNAFTTLQGVQIQPAYGGVQAGQSATVQIQFSYCPGNGSINFSSNGGSASIPVSVYCTPGSSQTGLTVTPSSLSSTSSNCSGSSSNLTCTVSLGETGTPGGLSWMATSNLSGVSFSPSNGTLPPSGTQTVTVTGLSCQSGSSSGSFAFNGNGNTVYVPWSCTNGTLTATPTSFDQTNCTADGAPAYTYHCVVTLGETSSSTANATWSPTTSSSLGSGVTFAPSGDTLQPGGTEQVTISSIPCTNGNFTFSGQSGIAPITVSWSCTLPSALSATPQNLDPNQSQCVSSSTSTFNCTITLAETASSQNSANWTASSNMSGVNFLPASGNLSPGGSITVSIDSIPCQGGSFTFSAGPGVTASTVLWNCIFTVSPTSLYPGTSSQPGPNCTWSSTNNLIICSVAVAVSSNVSSIQWSANTTLQGVGISPSNGSLSAGQSAQVYIGFPPNCSGNGAITFSSGPTPPIPVSVNCGPPPMTYLTVTPTSLSSTSANCSGSIDNLTCTVTLGEGGQPGYVSWSANSNLKGVSFSPSSDSLPTNGTENVTISALPCQNGSITFTGPAHSITIPWTCTAPLTLTVTPTSLDQTSCTATGSSPLTYQCSVTLGETSTSTGNVTWTASTDLGSGVSFSPSGDTLQPGSSEQVTISSIPCQNGNFTFSGQGQSNTLAVSWSCTPPPVLTVSPTSLDPTNANCTGGTSNPLCTVTLSEPASSQGIANWSASSALTGVSFSPANGQLTSGQSMQVKITAIPCSNGSFTFSGAEGETAVYVTWNCTPPPALTVSPSSLDQSNSACSATGSTYQCQVTLNETAGSQGNANWSANSALAGVSFSPASGMLQPGNSVPVTISSIPCQNGSFTFSGAEGETPVSVAWSCTVTLPALTVTPSSLSPSSPACNLQSSTYNCIVTLGETANSQGSVNFVAAISGTFVQVGPQNGTLTPGQTIPVTLVLGLSGCYMGEIIFSASNNSNVSPVTVQWQGSSCNPNLNINQFVLSDANPSCAGSGGSNYQCVINLTYDPTSPPGGIPWVVTPTNVNVTATPQNGFLLTAGQSAAVTIGNLSCSQSVLINVVTPFEVNVVTWDADPACSGSAKATIRSPMLSSMQAIGDVRTRRNPLA